MKDLDFYRMMGNLSFQMGGQFMSDVATEDTESPQEPSQIEETVYDALPMKEVGAGEYDDFEVDGIPLSFGNGLDSEEIDWDNIKPTLGNSPLHGNAPITEFLQHLRSDFGLNPSSVMSGKHNIGSKHYHGKALDLGLNTSFGGDKRKMEDFKNYFLNRQAQGFYTNIKLRDETTRPKGQKVWGGSHLHFEIQ